MLHNMQAMADHVAENTKQAMLDMFDS